MKNLKYAGLTAALVFGVTVGVSVTPAAKYGMAGCGLGSIVIQSNGILQIFAATTNGTSYNQFFAITSGTSNCSNSAAAFRKKQEHVYVTVNFSSLKHEMAAGRGEKLRSFASLLGCPSAQTAAFQRMAKKNYSVLAAHSSSPATLLKAVKASVKKDRSLAACQVI